jgi:hypothetical protein
MINIRTEFDKSKFEFDRSIDVKDVLPYSSKDYYIQPNELSYHETFNMKMSYLFDNLMYIYSRCFIANFEIAKIYKGFIGSRDTLLDVYEDTSDSENFSEAGYSELDRIKNFIAYKNKEKNYLFCNSLTSMSILEHDLKENKVYYKTTISLIDPVSGQIAFKNIGDMTINENFLYVSEKNLDVVYKYNLKKYFSEENIFKNKLFLEKSVGGEGERYEPIKFKNPDNISFKNNILLVEDYGNKTLKFFNNDLNFLSYKTLISFYDSLTSFSSFKFQNNENIVGSVKDGFFNFKFNNNSIKSSNFISLSSYFSPDEKILDVDFSSYNENIIYILTNKNLYKKWNYGNNKIIGKKSVSTYGNNSEFKSFSTIYNNVSSDLFYIYTYNSTASSHQILIFEDTLDLISTFSDPDFLIYSKDDIMVKKTEYNQSWVYTKSFKKLAKNYDVVRNSVSYKFLTEYDSNGVLNYVGKIYNSEVLSYSNINYDSFLVLGANENFQATVVNRELDKIYNFGKFLLDNVLSNANLTLNLNPSSF